MKNICSKYSFFIYRDLNALCFLYNGKKLTEIDLNLQFKKVINNTDYSKKYLELLVIEINDENSNKNNFEKANQIIVQNVEKLLLLKFKIIN